MQTRFVAIQIRVRVTKAMVTYIEGEMGVKGQSHRFLRKFDIHLSDSNWVAICTHDMV